MTAPETLVVVWTFADEDTTPATVLAHTPKSRDFQSGAPKWMDGERMVYVRRDPAVLARDETVLAMVGAAVSEELERIAVWALQACGYPELRRADEMGKVLGRQVRPDAAAALAARDKQIRDEALEEAAKAVDRRAQDYHDEHGIYDYSTGVTEYPGTGSESMEEWDEIAAAIRALKGGKE